MGDERWDPKRLMAALYRCVDPLPKVAEEVLTERLGSGQIYSTYSEAVLWIVEFKVMLGYWKLDNRDGSHS